MSSLLVAWSTWLALALFYAYQTIIKNIPNIIMDDIMGKYHVDANEIGHYAGIYYVGYVVMHIPLGIALDHFNAKKIIPICIILAVLGFVPLAYIDNFAITTYGRLLAGVGSSGAAVGAFTLLRLGFGEEKFPRMLGWMVTAGLLGSVFGMGPLSQLISYLGFIETLNYIIGFGILLAIFSYMAIPNTNTKSKSKFSFSVVINDFKYLFSNKIVLLISALGGLMIGPLEGFIDAWCNPYLKIVHHFTNEQASNITQLALIGMAAGLMVMGYIFEKTKSYYGIIIVSGIVMLSCFVIMLSGFIESPIAFKILLFTIGFFCAYQLIVIAKSIALVHVGHATFISAITNMIMMSFGYFFHRVIGKVLQYVWDGKYNILGNPLYSSDNLYNALMVLPISLAIAVLGYSILVIFEKKTKKIVT
ncbi:MAG: MFS transporter [Candidatus Midichloriaceae bacterium]